ncbi:GTPase [Lentinula raphanica]|nr:GTPase [Lentinula raphanica]
MSFQVHVQEETHLQRDLQNVFHAPLIYSSTYQPPLAISWNLLGGIFYKFTQNDSNISPAIPTPGVRPIATGGKRPSRVNEHDSEDYETYQRRRRTEWKRKQGGQTFLDHLIINVRGGKGGDGCAAFHREKFLPFGPPSGGNGGRGGDVYILPTPELTTLTSVAKRVRGENGGNGQGTWQNGKNGSPLVIRVPLGTIVRELPRDDPRRAKDEWEAEAEALEGLEPADKQARMRDNRWVHYPRYSESNVERDAFKEAEQLLYKQERDRRYARRKREMEEPIYLDLDKELEVEKDPNLPLGLPRKDTLGHLVASGGQGGLGNPHFLSTDNRSPKFATRGHEGGRITLSLELKLLADIGLVGMPNAGKSTLLRALTGGRAKTEVASYAFTTLNPIVGVVRVAADGSFEGGISEGMVHEETLIEETQDQTKMESGAFADALTRNQQANSDALTRGYGAGHRFDIVEHFRFTIADNPGLISQASANVGLGHSFLRSIERSLALVYVVDFSNPAPWDDLAILRNELEQYLPGMSNKARIVIANKADLLAADNDPASIDKARVKLKRLEEFVEKEMGVEDEDGNSRSLDVIPISAKYSQNLEKVVGLMQKYVIEARENTARRKHS